MMRPFSAVTSMMGSIQIPTEMFNTAVNGCGHARRIPVWEPAAEEQTVKRKGPTVNNHQRLIVT